MNPFLSFTSLASSPFLLSLYESIPLERVKVEIWAEIYEHYEKQCSNTHTCTHTKPSCNVRDGWKLREHPPTHTHIHTCSSQMIIECYSWGKGLLDPDTPRFKPWDVCCFLAVWSQACYLTSLNFSFLIYEIRTLTLFYRVVMYISEIKCLRLSFAMCRTLKLNDFNNYFSGIVYDEIVFLFMAFCECFFQWHVLTGFKFHKELSSKSIKLKAVVFCLLKEHDKWRKSSVKL